MKFLARFVTILICIYLVSFHIADAQTNGWEFPSTSSVTVGTPDNGKILSTENVPGSTITVTLPNPATVGQGWQMGFSEANGRGIILNAPGGVFILVGQKTMTSFTAPNNTNYEFFVIQSDGTNFRLLNITDKTAAWNGVQTISGGRTWQFLTSAGYSSSLADNGMTSSGVLAGGGVTVTLPSAPLLPNGWAQTIYPDGVNDITIQKNGVSGGTLVNPYGVSVSSYTIPASPKGSYAFVSFDGATFHVIQSVAMATPTTLVPGTAQTAARTAIGSNLLVGSGNANDTQAAFNTNFDNIGSVTTATSGTTLVNHNAVGGYLHNQMTAIRTGVGGADGVALYGQVYSEVNNSSSWGINTVTNDLVGLTGVILQAGEFDINVNNSSTKAEGITVIGKSTAQPTGGFSAFVAGSPSVQSIGSVIYTSGSFLSSDGAASAGLVLGAQTAPQANIGSQTINMTWYDSSVTAHAFIAGVGSNGTLNVVSSLPSSVTGIGMFNNVSSLNGTGTLLAATTLHGSLFMSETENGSNVAAGTVSHTGTGGLSVAPGTGGLFLIGLGSTPGGKSYACIDTSTGQIYGATGAPPGTC